MRGDHWEKMVPTKMGRAGLHQRMQHHSEGADANCISSSDMGASWSAKTVKAQCDNIAVVAMVNSPW